MAETKRHTRTIRHAAFAYTSVDGARLVAFRGETVDDLPTEEVERGEKFGAFASDGEPARLADTEQGETPWTLDGDGVGRTEDGSIHPDWLHRTTVADIEQIVANRPEVYDELRRAEDEGRQRKGVLDLPRPTPRAAEEAAPEPSGPDVDAADDAARQAQDTSAPRPATALPPEPSEDEGGGGE